MILDKLKRYEFAGDAYDFGKKYWHSESSSWYEPQFQHFADRGLVTEVEPEPVAWMSHCSEAVPLVAFTTRAIAEAAIAWANKEFSK